MRIPPQRLVVGIGLLALVGFLAAPLALAAGNSGDVKVHDPGENGLQKNDPHVGCAFFVEGFNMEASSGTITFKVWPPSGDKTVVHATGAAETWTSDSTNAHGNHHFLSGPYHLPAIGAHPQGTHYKVFVSDAKHDKMKVFWTKCTPPPCTVDCTPPPCTHDCAPPPCTENCAQVPFFPSTTSMVLGALGTVGTVAVAVLRRR